MVETYQDAICLPCRGAENGALYPNAKGGVYTAEKHPIKEAFLRREYRQHAKLKDGHWDQTTGHDLNHHPLIIPDHVGEAKTRLEGKYIFAGYLFPHYGHFLLESLANLWYIKKHPETPIIWLGVHNQSDMTDFNRELCELHGITNPIHILTDITSVEELVVPEPGYRIHTRYTAEQVNALKLVNGVPVIPGKKIWISRSRLSEGLVHSERLLEKILKENGWTIFHPQEFCVADQVSMLHNAEVIAGIEGSAMHSLVLMPEYKGQVHIFARGKTLNMDYILIADTTGINQQVHFPKRFLWTHGERHWAHNWIWPNLDFVLEKLEVKRLSKDVKPIKGDIDRILGSIAKGGRHFELMVELWPTSNSVGIAVAPTKTIAVSENFEFDLEHLKNNSISYLEMSADQLLTGNILAKTPDLYCFRAGTDLQIQIRAFNNSIAHSCKTTLWVIEGAPDSEEKNSAGDQLAAFIDRYYPMYSVAKAAGTNIYLVLQRKRQLALPSDSQLSDFIGENKKPSVPNLELRQIGKAYMKLISESHEPKD